MVVSKYFFQFQHNQRVRGTPYMIRPVVVGMIFAATITIAFTAFFFLCKEPRDHGIETDSKSFLFVYRHCGAELLVDTLQNKSPIAMIGISAALGIVGMLIGLE